MTDRTHVDYLEDILDAAEKAQRFTAGMRDKLIHDYVNVNLQIVWKTVQEDVPKVRRNMQCILYSLDG